MKPSERLNELVEIRQKELKSFTFTDYVFAHCLGIGDYLDEEWEKKQVKVERCTHGVVLEDHCYDCANHPANRGEDK